jgi:hypothetical protein
MSLADEIATAFDRHQRQEQRDEQRGEMNRALQRSGSWFRAAAKQRGLSAEEYQRALEAEAKQQRDAAGRFASAEPDGGTGLDQGGRGGPPAQTPTPSQEMGASLRDRFADLRGT